MITLAVEMTSETITTDGCRVKRFEVCSQLRPASLY
jgi:hypothetical protein